MTNTKKPRNEDLDQVIERPLEYDRAGEEEPNNPQEDKSKESSSVEQEESTVKYLRLMADFQNYKRRSEKERAEIHDGYSFRSQKKAGIP